jgi:hypothetical protein
VIHGSPHPPLWLRDHPHVAASGKAPSSRGKRNVPAGTSAAKRKQPEGPIKGKLRAKILLLELLREKSKCHEGQ